MPPIQGYTIKGLAPFVIKCRPFRAMILKALKGRKLKVQGVSPEKGEGVSPEKGEGVSPEKGEGVSPEKGEGVSPEKDRGINHI